jgi:aldehyde dehydrogenase (NAD+)
MLSENTSEFSEALSNDFKTAWSEKVFEVAALLGLIEATKGSLKAWIKPPEVAIGSSFAPGQGIVYREPYGVALIMGPFNAPLISLLRPAITALAAGNTCVLKVPEAPATAKLLLNLVPRYFEPRAVTSFDADPEQIARLLKLPFDFIFCTGSARVGRIIMRAAAEHLTPVLRTRRPESPRRPNSDRDLPKIMWGATAWGGQWCTSPGYAYVHESVPRDRCGVQTGSH